jgi:WD40 repeat protein
MEDLLTRSSKDFQYDAFISYRRIDAGFWAWLLRRRLRRFRLPKSIAPTTPRLEIYLDRLYARAEEDFFERTIKPALRNSRHLIVVQTPAALLPRSDGSHNWVVREIEYFRTLEQRDSISVALVKGTTDDLLPADLHKQLGNIHRQDIRPLAGIRGLFSNAAILPFVATLHKVPPSRMPDLAQEEEGARARRLYAALGMATLLLLIVGTLAAWALFSRQAALTAQREAVSSLDRAERELADSLATLARRERESGDPLAALRYVAQARTASATPLVTAESLALPTLPVEFYSTLQNDGRGASSAAFDPSGRWLAVGLFDGSVRLYRTNDWNLDAVISDLGSPVTGIAFSGGGQYFFVAHRTPPLEPDEASAGGLLVYEREMDGFRKSATLASPGRDPGFLSVASSGTAVRVVASNTDGVTEWRRHDWKAGSLLATSAPVASVAVRLDGSMVAGGSRDGHVWTWTETEDSPSQVAFRPPPSNQLYPWNAMGVAFDSAGRWLATGSYDGAVRIIGTDSKAFEGGHTDAVHTVLFSRDGRWLISGAWDGTARLWDARRGRVVARVRVAADCIQSVDVSPDGRWLVTVELIARSSLQDGRWRYGAVRLWRLTEPARNTNRSVGGLVLTAAAGPYSGT